MAGQAAISSSGSTLTVHQTSDHAIIHWQDFSISAGHTTTFVQPSATSAALNRVLGGNPSAIHGTLQSNGQIYLINPNGVLVGKNGVVNTGGFLASTLDVSDSDFLAGGDLRFSGGSTASVVNLGKIRGSTSDVILIAHTVENHGTIDAPRGTAALAAGSEVLVKASGQERVFVEAGSASGTSSATQAGLIRAAAAEIKAAGGNEYALAIKHSGVTRATGVRKQGGRVYLSAGKGKVQHSGTISARKGNGSGGKVRIEADHVELASGSKIDVSARGVGNGGEVLIGGGYQGKDASIRNAQTVTAEEGSLILADAATTGKGGTVILWSDGTTQFGGRISARGGAESGDGGFAEVSGKDYLGMSGFADLGATRGAFGTLLLDPGSVTIQDGPNASIDLNTFNDGWITSQLASASVTIQTSAASGGGAETITVNGNVNITWATPTTLTLNAGRNIVVNNGAVIRNTHNGANFDAIVMNAAGNGTGNYDGIRLDGATLRTTGSGNISLTGKGGSSGNGNIGISLWHGAVVESTGTGANVGKVTLHGTGGGGGGTLNQGVWLVDANTKISSEAGAISITGIAGGGGNNRGIQIEDGAVVESKGIATVTLTGTGGNGNTDNIGVFLTGTSTAVRSEEGAVSITGIGGDGSGPQNYGIVLGDGAVVESTGTGSDAATVTLHGTGGAGTSGNLGVWLNGTNTAVRSEAGNLSIIGVGGDGSSNGNYGIYLSNGAVVESTGTGADAATVTLHGTGGAGTSGNYGVRLNGTNTAVRSEAGNLSITGVGGDGSSDNNYGIYLLSGAVVESTGTGADAATVTLHGTGGTGTFNNSGVRLAGTNTAVRSEAGNLSITGVGGDGTGVGNFGILLTSGSVVESTGTGADAATVTLHGTGGSGTNSNYGVYLWETNTAVRSEAGNLSITGVGGDGTGVGNRGIYLNGGAVVESTGTGADAATVTLHGTGGAGTGNNIGVYLLGTNTAVRGDSGAVSITGIGGSGSDNHGIQLEHDAVVTSNATGDAVVLSTPGTFANFTGANAVSAPNGRWLIYSNSPGGNLYGGLVSGQQALYGRTITSHPPASVTETGNRYIFAATPSLTVQATLSASKEYGTAYTFPTPVAGTHYTVSGFVDASHGAFTQDTFANIGLTGAPVLASGGAAANAQVSGSPYTVTISQGTLANTAGYSFGTFTSGGGITVTPKALTITGVTADNKIYDGNTTATLSGGNLVGIVGSDSVQIGAGTGTFATANAGNGIIVTATGYTLTGAAAGNYSLTAQPSGITANITPKALTITGVTANNKIYDGNTSATLTGGSLVGIVGSDSVQIGAGTGTFATANVGNGIAVTATGYTLTGTAAGNYSLTAQPSGIFANITPKSLTITGVTANNKTYDGNTTATLAGGNLVGIVGSDSVQIGAGTGTFATANVANGIAVTATGYTLTGAAAGNYSLAGQPIGIFANITPKALTITGVTANNKIYDGNTTATLSGGSLVGIVGSDAVTLGAGTGTFATANVGNGITVTATGYTLTGAAAGNYSLLAQPSGLAANITPKALTITGVTAGNKIYDGNTSATLAGGTLTGIVGSDVVQIGAGTGTFATANVANGITVTASGYTLTGAAAGNYSLSAQPSGITANITPKALTITGVTASNKIYDGTTSATLAGGNLVGIVGSDTVIIGAGSGTFASANVGNGITVTATGYTLTGAAAGNYSLSAQPTGLLANITPKSLTLTGVTATNKIYDGNTSATFDLSGAALDGLVSGDTVTFTGGSGTFADVNAGIGIAVTASGFTIGGADAGNYTLAGDPAGLSADITPKSLTITADDASREEGQPNPAFTASFDGFILGEGPGDLAGVLGFGTAATPASLPGAYAITSSGLISGNYAITFVDGTLTVSAATTTIPENRHALDLSGSPDRARPFGFFQDEDDEEEDEGKGKVEYETREYKGVISSLHSGEVEE